MIYSFAGGYRILPYIYMDDRKDRPYTIIFIINPTRAGTETRPYGILFYIFNFTFVPLFFNRILLKSFF
jgi:hypothetical protein